MQSIHCHVPKTDRITLQEKEGFQFTSIYIIKTNAFGAPEAFGLKNNSSAHRGDKSKY